MKAIGIDIGGTQTRIAVFEQEKMINQQNFKTDVVNPHNQVKMMVKTINQLTSEYDVIGVACPGPLNVKQGIILNPPNLPGWQNFPLKSVLEQETNKLVIIDNDANLAAFAEASIGSGKQHDVVQFLTISTGVGAGLVIDGKIFHGAKGFAQEVANCIVDQTSEVPGKTIKGSVERICSGTGIYHLATHQGMNVSSTAEVFEMAKKNNIQAKEIINYASDMFANFLANIQGIIDPSVIIIGGSVALHNPEFIDQIVKEMKKKVYANVSENINVVLAECGDAAGVIGAGLWAQKQQKIRLNEGR